MKQHLHPETFPVTPYTPKELMALDWLEEEWTNNRLFAWDVLNDDASGLSLLERGAAPLISLIVGLDLILLIIALQVQIPVNGMAAFTSPIVVVLGLALIPFVLLAAKVSRVAKSLRNAADSTIFSTVGRWIRARYGVSIDFGDNLADILNEEIVRNGKNEDYYLDAVVRGGKPSLIVRQRDGLEAPVLS
jgi:hypothetical protein